LSPGEHHLSSLLGTSSLCWECPGGPLSRVQLQCNLGVWPTSIAASSRDTAPWLPPCHFSQGPVSHGPLLLTRVFRNLKLLHQHSSHPGSSRQFMVEANESDVGDGGGPFPAFCPGPEATSLCFLPPSPQRHREKLQCEDGVGGMAALAGRGRNIRS
jgi:hypothetical protein